jgi:hypothetical protein
MGLKKTADGLKSIAGPLLNFIAALAVRINPYETGGVYEKN